jgi:hypothetical protein
VAVSDDRGASSKGRSETESESGGGPFEEIRIRMRALSNQLLAPASAPVASGSAAPRDSEPPSRPIIDAFPKSPPDRHARRDSGAPSAFERPIRALTEKAQSVLPKVRLRFDAETDYALSILRRLRGGRQPFGIEEVRELINGKFGLTLTNRDDAQLSASLANQDGLTRGPKGGASNGATSWRFETG